MGEFILGPALFLGAIIGIYEAMVLHRDVNVATHRFGHMIHAFILSIVFTFATMNVDFVFATIPALKTVPLLGIPLVFRIAIGLVAAIKIHATSRVIKSRAGGGGPGLGETWFHSLLIGAIIAAAPYAYPLLEPMIPGWVKF